MSCKSLYFKDIFITCTRNCNVLMVIMQKIRKRLCPKEPNIGRNYKRKSDCAQYRLHYTDLPLFLSLCFCLSVSVCLSHTHAHTHVRSLSLSLALQWPLKCFKAVSANLNEVS